MHIYVTPWKFTQSDATHTHAWQFAQMKHEQTASSHTHCACERYPWMLATFSHENMLVQRKQNGRTNLSTFYASLRPTCGSAAPLQAHAIQSGGVGKERILPKQIPSLLQLQLPNYFYFYLFLSILQSFLTCRTHWMTRLHAARRPPTGGD